MYSSSQMTLPKYTPQCVGELLFWILIVFQKPLLKMIWVSYFNLLALRDAGNVNVMERPAELAFLLECFS